VRVSVALAVYNARWCVERALESVLAQTEPPAEVVVGDDGSTDGTADLIESRFGGAVRVLRFAHRNASACRREAIAQTTGDWVALLDADDLWHPDKLAHQRAFAARHPEVRWFSSDGRYVSAEGVERESWLSDYFDPVQEMAGNLLPGLVHRCFPLVSSMLVERRAYEDVGGLDPGMVYSHDYDLWLRLAARYPGGVMTERLIDYFTGPATLSRNYEGRFRDDLELMRRVAGGGYGAERDLRRLAAGRAAEFEFRLAVHNLRAGRIAEARSRLVRAARGGPWRRRVLAAGGAILPARALGWMMRSRWAKDLVIAAGRRPSRVPQGGSA
jgi:glycosyltransferase involved in cell wall biosynthesis